MVGGLHTSAALIVHNGAQSGIQLQLSPLVARPLLGLPAGELASLDVGAREILGPLATEVSERIQDAVTWPVRFAVPYQLPGNVLHAPAARWCKGQAGPPSLEPNPPTGGIRWSNRPGRGPAAGGLVDVNTEADAIAVTMVDGRVAGGDLLEPALGDPQMIRKHCVTAILTGLLEMDGRAQEAGTADAVAAPQATNIPEQRYLNANATPAGEINGIL